MKKFNLKIILNYLDFNLNYNLLFIIRQCILVLFMNITKNFMTIEYYYLLMSQQDLLQNEVIEEIVRERVSSYALQNKRNDFWILISPEFVKLPNIEQKIKQTNFYKQKKINLIAENNSEFYGAIISINKEFITWLSLRLGYFENIETFTELKTPNVNYVSNGIFGQINTNENLKQISPLKGSPKYITPSLLSNKYKKLLELSYNFIKI